jgi:hypothetical protein
MRECILPVAVVEAIDMLEKLLWDLFYEEFLTMHHTGRSPGKGNSESVFHIRLMHYAVYFHVRPGCHHVAVREGGALPGY